MGELKSKELRVLKALKSGAKMNTSLIYEGFKMSDKGLVEIDASNGSHDMGMLITAKGEAALSKAKEQRNG